MKQVFLLALVLCLAVTWCHAKPEKVSTSNEAVKASEKELAASNEDSDDAVEASEKDLAASNEDSDDAVEASEKDLASQLEEMKTDSEEAEAPSTKVSWELVTGKDCLETLTEEPKILSLTES